jgi:peptide/nickel transport system substrate-binding protein
VRARRALAYALDRDHYYTGGNGGLVACQLLPPGFPGYAPHCPFTSNPDTSGGYHGPDLARARAMVRKSGTKGATVTMLTNLDNPFFRERELGRVLRQLGWRVELQTPDDVGGQSFDPRVHKDISGTSWFADYPAASNFYFPLLSCASRALGSTFSLNIGHYCNPDLDRLANEALATQATDPGAADREWRRVFRVIDDDAVVLPQVHRALSVIVSKRVGNYQASSMHGTYYDQMWIR